MHLGPLLPRAGSFWLSPGLWHQKSRGCGLSWTWGGSGWDFLVGKVGRCWKGLLREVSPPLEVAKDGLSALGIGHGLDSMILGVCSKLGDSVQTPPAPARAPCALGSLQVSGFVLQLAGCAVLVTPLPSQGDIPGFAAAPWCSGPYLALESHPAMCDVPVGTACFPVPGQHWHPIRMVSDSSLRCPDKNLGAGGVKEQEGELYKSTGGGLQSVSNLGLAGGG